MAQAPASIASANARNQVGSGSTIADESDPLSSRQSGGEAVRRHAVDCRCSFR